ncbi:hypothetical protein Gocc_2928 [Gaiella occulta]|uniref:Uncharacterized protein n=1 Tax=Gaiella occulta TaxID=1002870 RepID=A0A7M2YV74_9ACTN|nr:hypothetical protein Gocc_2928 [Gaiella occulta]
MNEPMLLIPRRVVKALEVEHAVAAQQVEVLRDMLAGAPRSPVFAGRCCLCGAPASGHYCHGCSWAGASGHSTGGARKPAQVRASTPGKEPTNGL